tara:strand:+ start:42125 stop:43099 length:975 start_codon:yes stop_codon:yes gene_type:complete
MLLVMSSTVAAHAVHSPEGSQQHVFAGRSEPPMSIDDLLQQYSLEGDDRLLALAREQLPPQAAMQSVQALLHAAWLAQAEHEFAHARVLVAEVVRQQPHNGQAWLLEAAIADVVGDRRAAREACGHVMRSVSPQAAMVCFAALAETTQEKRVAYTRLQHLPTQTNDSRLAAWRWSVQADLARGLGDSEAAEALLRRAIALFPAVQTRATLLDVLLHQARYREVLSLVGEYESVPALAVRRLQAQVGSGESPSAAIQQMDRRFRTWLAQGDYRHAREMAMFYLDVAPHADVAFQIAKKNATLQREPEDLALLRRAEKLKNTEHGS